VQALLQLRLISRLSISHCGNHEVLCSVLPSNKLEHGSPVALRLK
jgi:hypothetical protein